MDEPKDLPREADVRDPDQPDQPEVVVETDAVNLEAATTVAEEVPERLHEIHSEQQKVCNNEEILLKDAKTCTMQMVPPAILEQVGQTDEMEELQKDACDVPEQPHDKDMEEMPMQDVAETAGAMAEAPSGWIILHLFFASLLQEVPEQLQDNDKQQEATEMLTKDAAETTGAVGEAETCRVEAAPSAILEQAGRLVPEQPHDRDMEEMPMQDVAETAGAMAEAETCTMHMVPPAILEQEVGQTDEMEELQKDACDVPEQPHDRDMEEMPMQDVAEKAGAMAEAETCTMHMVPPAILEQVSEQLQDNDKEHEATEMLTKDAAETTGAVGEAPTLVVVLCLPKPAEWKQHHLRFWNRRLELMMKWKNCRKTHAMFQSSPTTEIWRRCPCKMWPKQQGQWQRLKPAQCTWSHLRFWSRRLGRRMKCKNCRKTHAMFQNSCRTMTRSTRQRKC
eukprot:symbB.v1.2.011458.t2/scaffold713.1/size170176/7